MICPYGTEKVHTVLASATGRDGRGKRCGGGGGRKGGRLWSQEITPNVSEWKVLWEAQCIGTQCLFLTKGALSCFQASTLLQPMQSPPEDEVSVHKEQKRVLASISRTGVTSSRLRAV